MAKLTREQSKALTRQKLIETARMLLVENGYHGCSVANIANAAGFSKGAFFANFASKESLLLEVLRQEEAAAISALRTIIEQAQDNPLQTVIENYMQRFREDKLCVMLDIEMSLQAKRNPIFAEEYNVFQENTKKILGELLHLLFQKAGRKMPFAEEAIADLVIALVQGIVLRCDKDLEQWLQFILGLILESSPIIASAK